MRDSLYFIKSKFNDLSPKKRLGIVSALTATAVMLGAYALSSDNNEDYVYLVDLANKYEDDATLVDENGEAINVDTEDNSNLLAIVGTKKTKKDNQYKAIIVNEDGKMFSGYMDGKYLEDKSIDKVEVKNDVLDEVNIVFPQSGLWLRDNEEKKIDNHTDDAYCLPADSYVATSSIFETSKDNSYQWKEAVYVDDKELKHGYLVGDYVRSDNFSEIEGKRFVVGATNGIGLKLRSEASIDSSILTCMEDGTEVVLLPNVASISDGTYDWFYVATKTEEGIKTGYAAATYYTPNGVIHYLTYQKDKSDNTNQNGSPMVVKSVDTSKDNSVPLKLREEPGTDSKIISEIEDGTKIYTYQNLIDTANESQEIDGHKWIQIYLTNGKTGYVASDYLVEEEKNNDDDKKDNKESDSQSTTLDFNKEGTVEGYFGIDVKNNTPATDFEKLVTTDSDYTSANYSVNRDVSAMKRPQFVMFKLGATYTSTSYETATLAEDNYTSIDNLRSMVAICEENHIPYGFYYYSQAINDKDVDIEANYIHEALSQLGTSAYHILPFAVDMEDQIYVNNQNIDTRIAVNAQNNGKEQQTDVMNKLMNRVRDDNNLDVISYLSRSGYSRLINHQQLDEINQENPWIVNPSDTHSIDFVTNYPDVLDEVSMRQIALDGSVGGVAIDVNLMNKEYYDKLLKDNNLTASNNKSIMKTTTVASR